MMSGLGFEAEDPKELFARTFVFAFLLLASRQVCDVGLGISSAVITMLRMPPGASGIFAALPAEDAFSIGASWLLAIIVGFVIIWQLVKMFFEIGERYFLVGFLTITAPWAFAMGGSRSTADIFKGWVRMYASMCLMMILNVVFLKMLLSAMSAAPVGAAVLPWMIFVVAIARVARKIDSIIARIGLNPAITGEGLGRTFPGMLSYMVIRSALSNVSRSTAAAKSGRPAGGGPPPAATSPAGSGGPAGPAGSGGGTPKQGGAGQRPRGGQSKATDPAQGPTGSPARPSPASQSAAQNGMSSSGFGPAGSPVRPDPASQNTAQNKASPSVSGPAGASAHPTPVSQSAMRNGTQTVAPSRVESPSHLKPALQDAMRNGSQTTASGRVESPSHKKAPAAHFCGAYF
jgi:hypothetical protein